MKEVGISRRCFLRYSGLALASTMATGLGGAGGPVLAAETDGSPWQNKAMLNDAAKCIGCLSCVAACKKANGLPEENKYSLETSAETWTTVRFNKTADGKMINVKMQCMHCTNPSCAGICPTGAAHKTDGGVVVIDQEICVGCRNCMVACPYNIPGFSEEEGTVRKCEFCRERVAKGLIPACAEACPAGAIEFGDRSALLTKAARRVGELVSQGYDKAQVYGVQQLGGLKVLYVLPEPPEILGLPGSPKQANGDVVLKWATGILVAGFLAMAPLRAIFRAPEEKAGVTHQKEGGKTYDV